MWPSQFFTLWYYQIPFLIGLTTTCWLLLKFWRHVREQQIRLIPAGWNGIRAHQWRLIQCLTHKATCCSCRSLIVDAMYCDSCGVCLDFACYKMVTKSSFFPSKHDNVETNDIYKPLTQCKTISVSRKDQTEWEHHWVHGNLPTQSKCFICDDYCLEDDVGDQGDSKITSFSGQHTLFHYRCCWCQRTVHENCYQVNRLGFVINGQCDFGSYSRYLIPPHCIIFKRVWSSARQKTIALDSVRNFAKCGWSPLLVIANRKSGNNNAGIILSKFLAVLNPVQVIDLSEKSNALDLALQICQMLPENIVVRILVAGGDGTVGWVLNSIIQSKLSPVPLVAIYPLGTGNDLARVLKWDKISDCLDRDQVIENIYNAQPIDLDRWSIKIKLTGYYRRSYNLLVQSLHIPRSIMPLSNRDMLMYNYFSVGVDALVALNFHETRKSSIYKFFFTNTLVNKFLYFTYGTKDLWERRCKNLHKKIQIELDDEPIELPELESLVILNIPSWGGGVQLNKETVLNDSKVEVLGLTSTFHIGQLMIGMSKPISLGQASKVKLVLMEHLPVQVDGEPWLQAPANINIIWNSHAKLLKNVDF